MKPAGLLAALALAQAADAQVVARLHAEPAEVGVGEVCRLVLEVEHPEGATVRLPAADPLPDDSWVLAEARRVERPWPDRTVATWKCLPLEAGEHRLPTIRVDVGDASGMKTIDAEAGTLRVRPALAEGEDAPRPMRGFRPAPPVSAGSRARWLLAGLLLALVAVVGALAWRRAQRKAAPVAEPTPLDRLAEIGRLAAEDEKGPRRAVYALSRLLRGTVDRWLAQDRAALVDAEWVARVEADDRVPLGARRAVAKTLRDSERIKYALGSPTRFALEEMLADARERSGRDEVDLAAEGLEIDLGAAGD